MPELRRDPIVGRWVIIATERAKRPTDYKSEKIAARAGSVCPLCPGHEDKTPPAVLVYREGDSPQPSAPWTVRVVPNKYPVLKIEGDIDRRGEGLYDKMNGIGAHEVIVETSSHGKQLADLDPPAVESVLRAYSDRLLDLARDVRFRYGMVFKNHGAAAGATLEHSHSQLIALPVVPAAISAEMQGAERYYEFKERCIFCDIIRTELAEGKRVIYENDGFVVTAPYAPRFPFETWILPKHHSAAFEHADRRELAGLAAALRTALRKLNVALECPPYTYALHTAAFGQAHLSSYHWHIEIMPTRTRVAGFELGSWFYINATPPEDAAAFLRELAV